jgi:triphosphatase
MDELLAIRHSSARTASAGQRLLRKAAHGKPRRLKLNRKMRADEAFRAILADCLGAISAQAGVLRTGRSVEALHHLRVGLRRLEVMLAAFGKAFGQDWFTELRGRAKAISARLGPARDMDVFLTDLWVDGTRGGGDFASLRRAAETMQANAWEAVEDCIVSEDFAHLLDDIAALSQSSLPLGHGRRLKPIARGLLDDAARRVARRGRKAKSHDEAELHRLRIGLKKLRYLTQAFAGLYSKKKLTPYLASLKQLQEELGHLNDIAHVRATIAELMRGNDTEAIGYGAGLIQGHYAAGRERAAQKAMKRYRDFKAIPRFWKK